MERKLNKRCIICGKPCRTKYCDDCRKKAYRQYKKEWHLGKRKTTYKGCNEDCLNCKYPDCLKPANEMQSDHLIKVARPSETESAPHMYTVELGKINTIIPNVNRSYYK